MFFWCVVTSSAVRWEYLPSKEQWHQIRSIRSRVSLPDPSKGWWFWRTSHKQRSPCPIAWSRGKQEWVLLLLHPLFLSPHLSLGGGAWYNIWHALSIQSAGSFSSSSHKLQQLLWHCQLQNFWLSSINKNIRILTPGIFSACTNGVYQALLSFLPPGEPGSRLLNICALATSCTHM